MSRPWRGASEARDGGGAYQARDRVARGRASACLLVPLALLTLVPLALAGWLWRDISAGPELSSPPHALDADQVQRGEYLARIGNCLGCHTARGGASYAGGRPLETPFGTVYASNLTPDDATGIGRWSAEAFWRALHHGVSRDGRLLYPAFPYTNTTHVSRADSDALHAYLRSLRAVNQPNRGPALRFPYNTQAALAVWRALYFRPADADAAMLAMPSAPLPAADRAAWQRGAYLVRGLGHCSACHSRRNALGGTGDASQLDGGLMPVQNWYAPSLQSPDEAGVRDWQTAQIVALLRTGTSDRGTVHGPMAEVVHGSTQHLTPTDAAAMANYLKSLPAVPSQRAETDEVADVPALRQIGEQRYADRCAGCHGERGEGVPGAYPALAGNRVVLMNPPVNLVQLIVHGGFAPSTAGNARPYGMPPYGLELKHSEIAALLTYLRSAWGNQASAVSPLSVQRWRERID